MNDDELMNALGATQKARKEDGLDPRWAQLNAGTLPPEEVAALEKLAQESSEDARRWAMFAPLDAAFGADVKSMAQAHLEGADPGPLAPTLPIRQQWALMAACALVVLGTVVLAGARTDPLPAYALEWSGGDQLMRAAPQGTGPMKVSPGARLQAILRPHSASDVPVDALVIAQGGDTALPVPMKMERDPEGPLRLTGTLGQEIKLRPGEWRLIVLLGPAGELEDWRPLLEEGAAADDDVQRFERALIITQ